MASEYISTRPSGGVSKSLDNLTSTAINVDLNAATDGGISIGNGGTKASVVIQDLTITAISPGVLGNGLSIQYVNGGGVTDSASFVTNGIVSQISINVGHTTASTINSLINSQSNFYNSVVSGVGSNLQTVQAPTLLAGGVSKRPELTYIQHGISLGDGLNNDFTLWGGDPGSGTLLIGNATDGNLIAAQSVPTASYIQIGTQLAFAYFQQNTAQTALQLSFAADGYTFLVSTSGSTPNASALIQADSTTQGILPPRMTNAQIHAIATPAEGLIAYDTDNHVLAYYNGTAWQQLSHTALP